MSSAGKMKNSIRLQRASKEQGALGVTEAWETIKTFTGSCEYVTQRFRPGEGSTGEGDATWIVRTRANLNVTREVGRFRFITSIRGQGFVFYPKGFPIYKGDETRIDCEEAETEVQGGGYEPAPDVRGAF